MPGFQIHELATIKRLAEAVPEAVYIVDASYSLLYTNRAFRQKLGLRAPRLAGTRCSDSARLGLCSARCVLSRCLETGAPTLWEETIAGEGTEFALQVSASAQPLVDETGKVAGALVLLRDIDTELRAAAEFRAMLEKEKRAKEELERTVDERTRELRTANQALEATNHALSESKREIEELLDNIRQAVFTVGVDLRVSREFSAFARDVFGDVPIADRRLVELLEGGQPGSAPAQQMLDWLRLVFAQPFVEWEVMSQLVERELRYLRPTDGSTRELVLDVRPLRDAAGNIRRVMFVFEDLTEKRALERDLVRKEVENEENLKQVAEIIRLDPEIFRAFLSEADGLLVDAQVALADLPRARSPQALVDRLFRQVHTLKGNARSFQLQRIARRAHIVEETLSRIRGGAAVEPELVSDIAARLEELKVDVGKARDLGRRIMRPDLPEGATEEPSELSFVTERQSVSREWLRNVENELADLCATGPQISVDRLRSVLDRFRQLGFDRMSRLYVRLPHLVADVAQQLGKRIQRLALEGEDTLVDRRVIHELGTPIIHLLRNAIDHGLERPEEREQARKEPGGTITVRSRYDRESLIVEIIDDGRGIDHVSLTRKAVERGFITDEEAARLSRVEALRLIFRPGLTTAPEVSEISGRGVGLDLVATSIHKLGGSVGLTTRPRVGTRFRLRIPREIAEGRMSPTALASLASQRRREHDIN